MYRRRRRWLDPAMSEEDPVQLHHQSPDACSVVDRYHFLLLDLIIKVEGILLIILLGKIQEDGGGLRTRISRAF
jgi:hypothetical protein